MQGAPAGALFREPEHRIWSRRHYQPAREPPHRRNEHDGHEKPVEAATQAMPSWERAVVEQQGSGGTRMVNPNKERSPADARATPPASAGRALRPLAGLGLIVGLFIALWWMVDYVTVGQYLVHTDEAYVGGNEVPVRSAVPGRVSELLVTDHQEIAAGQLLARIAPREADTATVALNDVIAPVAGVVTVGGLHVGDVVTADRSMMAVATPGEPHITAVLAVSDITYVALGQAVTIEVPGLPSIRLYGHVADAEWIGAAPGSPNGEDRVALKIRLKTVLPAGLRPGMAVSATILTGLTGTERMVSEILQEKAQRSCRCGQDLQPASVRRRI
ncbi:HlyD family secretion protein [Bradyrhizobium sp. HKCCYLRH3099]|uniref:HlyD family secretion protein n=1 Tax=unclassified Bradyrhizobium TaxID=2631580 RepID=UPI003EB81DBF